jgi:GNAT superfamily N-acetyltransferase
MFKAKIVIANTQPEHCEQIHQMLRQAYDLVEGEECAECMSTEHLRRQLERFGQGHFVALYRDLVVGYAITMRTKRSPYELAQTWLEAIGDLTLCNHEPDGKWLYGVEFFVRPAFRRQGIGTRLYHARFRLVRRLNLRGFYAGGMLRGYKRYYPRMSVREYARRVRQGEIKDPTVTMQLNRGFKPLGVIEKYIDAPPAEASAMLIVWNNQPDEQAIGKGTKQDERAESATNPSA